MDCRMLWFLAHVVELYKSISMKLTTKMHFTQEMHKNSVTYVFMIPDGS